MNQYTLPFLHAIPDMTAAKHEIVPFLAQELGVNTEELFYLWGTRTIEQLGTFKNHKWRYFFHGNECDVWHLKDKRFLRIDFGPDGRIDTFTAWGILQYIMASVPPWPDYGELRDYLDDRVSAPKHLSGCHSKASALFDELRGLEYFQHADSKLCEIVAACTTIGKDGIAHLKLPEDFTEKNHWDAMVCHRWILSDKGIQRLNLPQMFTE